MHAIVVRGAGRCIRPVNRPVRRAAEFYALVKPVYVAVLDCRVELAGVYAVGAGGVRAGYGLALAVYRDVAAAVYVECA